MTTGTAVPFSLDDDLQPIDVAFEASSDGPAPEKPPTDEASGLPMLSRRAMLGGLAASTLAASGMMMLPKERGGVLFAGFNPLGADAAYASNIIWSGSFSFKVVGADQVGIQILDVSGLTDLDEGEVEKKGRPVEDATVTLTSLFNDAVVSDTTDEEGKVILPIRALAFSTTPSDGVFRTNCSLSVTTEDARVKMRDFSTGRVCLEGATGIVIGTHKTDSADVYLERCTFNDWDIHYSKLTFLRSEVNKETHAIEMRVNGTTKDVAVDMEVLDAKTKKTVLKKRSTTAKYSSESKLVECSFEGHFLQTGHDDCITADDAIIRITLTVDGKSYENDLEVSIQDTPFDEAIVSTPMLPITTGGDSLFTFHTEAKDKKKWPCFNGLTFSVLGPFPAIQVSTSILATTVGIGTDFRMMDDDGHWAPKDCWKKDHKGNIFARYKNLYNRKMADLDERNKTNKDVEMQDIGDPGNPGEEQPQATSQKNKYLSNCEVNVIGRLALLFKWDSFSGEHNKFTGEGTIALGFSAAGTLTLEFMAGPLPMYASATLGLTAMAAFTVATTYELQKTEKEIDCSDMGWSVNKSFGIYLKPFLALSIGVGYKGLVSLSFEATFAFPMYFGWLQAGGEGQDNPHVTVGVSILLEIVLQMLLFKLSGQIYSYSDDTWYDNWPKKSIADALTGQDAWTSIEPRFRLTQPDGSYRHTLVFDENGNLLLGDASDPFAGAVPTTDAMMKNTSEAVAKRAGESDATGLTDERLALLKKQRSAEFTPVSGVSGVFTRPANERAKTPTTVFVGKMPKAVVQGDGSIVTELVDCEGVNTFYFGEPTPEMLAATAGSAGGTAEDAMRESVIVVSGATANSDATAAGATLMAGTLVAQEEPRFEGDPLLGFALGATREYDYTAVAGKTTGEPCGPIGVEGIAAHDGVVPTADAVIYKNVHSDPRQRVVSIGGVPYLFRIMTVEYPDTNNGCFCRSRVVASKYDDRSKTWGEPKVIEYGTGNRDLPRIDIYDYEFDIAVRTGDDPWTQDGEACLIVTGGLRPEGDTTSFHDTASNGTVAVLVIDKDLTVLQFLVRGMQEAFADARLSFDESQEHMLCSPVIVDGFGAGGASGSLAYAFLRRSASTKLGLATTGASVSFCVGHCYVRGGYLSLPKDLKENPDIALAADVFGMKGVAGDAAKGYDALLTLVINHQQGYDVCTATIPSGEDFDKLQITHNIASSDTLPEIQPWPHHGTFLFVKDRPAVEDGPDPDYHLYQGTFDVGKGGQTGFVPKQVDTAGLKGASFCVSPNGEFIFYYESYRDKPNSNPEADVVSSNVTGTGDDTVHHIMAARLLNGKFCEDFPFCEVDHPIDHIEIIDVSDGASAFVATHITDADNSVADLRYIGVPNVLSAEIEAFMQSQPFVCAGNPATFSVDIRNHGNLIIGGFDLQMIDPANGSVVGTVHEGEIEPTKITPTADNMGWGPTSTEVPTLSAEEQQGMLMPGKRISYEATFNIPGNWSGTKTVIVRIANAWTPRAKGSNADMTAAAFSLSEGREGLAMFGQDGGVHHYHLGKKESVSLIDSGQGEGTIYDPDERVNGNKPTPVNPNNPGGGSGGNSRKGPYTGDSLGSMGPLALALAGAAALAAGYSARRLHNEREARKANGEGEE